MNTNPVIIYGTETWTWGNRDKVRTDMITLRMQAAYTWSDTCDALKLIIHMKNVYILYREKCRDHVCRTNEERRLKIA
jgi:hypothetical protein